MARQQTNTVGDLQEEFRDLLAQHHRSLPGKEPFRPPGCRDGVSLAVEVISDDDVNVDQLNVIEARNPLVYSANLSVSFRNEPRLSVSRFKFDWVFHQEEEEGVKFSNIGAGLINMAIVGGTGLFFSVGKIDRKQSFLRLCSQIASRLLEESRETVMFSLIKVQENVMVDLLGGGKRVKFIQDKAGQSGERNLLEKRLTSQQQLCQVFSNFSNVVSGSAGSVGEIIKFRLAGSEYEDGGEIYLVNLTGGELRDPSPRGLRDCLLARSHSPAPLSPLTKLLWRPLSADSGLISKIVVLGAVQPGIQHQEDSLATLHYLSGLRRGERGERGEVEPELCEENPQSWGREELDVWLQLSHSLTVPQSKLLSGSELLKLTSKEFNSLFQSFRVLPPAEMRDVARSVREDLWELYRSHRENQRNKKLSVKKEFVTRETPKKSYQEILNGGQQDEEREKLRAELGGISRRLFEVGLNKEFEGNRARYEKKNKEMMEMEWTNKVAASDRAEARLFPILNIDTAGNQNQGRRRKSIYD